MTKKEKLQAFAKRLKILRKQNNISITEMCKFYNMRPPNYLRYENGTQEPGALRAIQLATAMKTTVEAMFDSKNNKNLEALQCKAWFKQRGFETTSNNNNEITILIKNLAPITITLNEAYAIIKQANQNINPIFRAITMETIIESQNKVNLEKIPLYSTNKEMEIPEKENEEPMDEC